MRLTIDNSATYKSMPYTGTVKELVLLKLDGVVFKKP
jgi:hypothetical protein